MIHFMKTVGIIGFGSFGKFLAEKLDPYFTVSVFSYSNKPNQWQASLDDVAAADFLLLAIPLDAYRSTLQDIKPKLGSKTVLVDVCSVKVEPVEVIKSVLPNVPIIATHPLFGPESAAESVRGHTVVLCPENSEPEVFGQVKQFCEQLEMEVIVMSADEHDQEMAVVQGLTFFIARALKDLDLHDQKLSTPSFKKLLQLAELEKHHSDELFKTIQNGNPKTKAIRQKFIDLSQKLDVSING